MKIEIDGVYYWDDGHIAGAKTVLEKHGFGLQECTSDNRILIVDIYSHPVDNETAVRIGRIVRNFGNFADFVVSFEYPHSPNSGTAKRVAKAVEDLIVF